MSTTEKTTKKTAEGGEAPIVPKEIDIHQYIPVVNGFQGTLVYVSKRTGERYLWEHFGAEQDMELQELRNARSASHTFFKNNWFMFHDEDRWVIDYLGMQQYYKDALALDEFDAVFTMTPAKVRSVVSGLSDGQKQSLAYRAREAIASGEIDSIKTITALEESLGIELIEK